MDSSGKQLLSVEEVHQTYQLSRYTIYTLIKSDPTFPCVNVGPRKNYRIHADRFVHWLEQRIKERQYYEFEVPTADQLYKTGRNWP